MSIDDWIKMGHISTMEQYSAIKSEIQPLATRWMNLEDIMLSKANQTEIYKYHTISPIYMQNLKNRTKQNKKMNKPIDTDDKLMATKGKWGYRDGNNNNF